MQTRAKILSFKAKNNGAALLTVLIAVFILTLMTLELQYTSMVEQKLAYNDLNQLQAYYLAKTGARIGTLRVALFLKALNNPTLKALPKELPIKTLLDSIWSLPLPAFPPEKAKLAVLTKSDQDSAEKILSETMISEGQTTHVISSEGAKINLNSLQIPEARRDKPFSFNEDPKSPEEYTARLLVNLIEGFIRDSENPSDEFGDLRPTELVADIMDWVNAGNSRILGGDKDQFYQKQTPPYKAKRGRFFTLEELKMVKGIDDTLYSKLRPHVTVYAEGGKINLNLASDKVIRALYYDFTDDDIKRIKEKKTELTNWPNVRTFVDFVTKDLNRTGFGEQYKDENEYPFTVDTKSFIVESMGFIKRNKTQIQKLIRVGLALTNPKGVKWDDTIKDIAKCDSTKARFWYIQYSRCGVDPTTRDQCIDNFGGTWQINSSTNAYDCKLNNQGYTGVETDGKVQEPNAVKVLFWQEV